MSQDHSQDHSQPLAQLLDIHAAAEPGWWPPAPGWWVLGLLLLLVAFFIGRMAARGLAAERRRRAWMDTLQSIDALFDPVEQPRMHLAALNRLFRAVALKAFPGTECARLEGDRWVGFISGLMPEGRDLTPLNALSSGPYQPAPEFDHQALHSLATDWVKRYG